ANQAEGRPQAGAHAGPAGEAAAVGGNANGANGGGGQRARGEGRGRGQGQGQGNGHGQGPQGGGKGKGGKNQPRRDHDKQDANRRPPKRAEKPVDPDSPFAILAQLKNK
ncbi:MAG: hypothetical protein AAF074_19220, partial [Pseudomonadota bacterium]